MTDNASAQTTESDHVYRFRWTTGMDVLVTVTVGRDDLEGDEYYREEYAYDVAVERAKERLEQIAVDLGGVSVHGDIDGMEAHVEHVTSPGAPS